MAKRPKPTALRTLSGNAGHRKINKNEPKPTSIAECPAWIVGTAKAEWDRVAPELEALGLLSGIDVAALAGYCSSFARWREAEDHLEVHGLTTVSSKSGFAIVSPFVAISNSAKESMRKFAIEFGGTPSARSKVSATPRRTEEDKKWAKFLDSPF